MPPWRTVAETRSGPNPLSFTTMASASSAALRCCTSKSGGTYSASITGVSGSTLTKRIVPSAEAAIINAVATAGLARSGSARSIGTKIFLYMTASLCDLRFRAYCHGCGRTVSGLLSRRPLIDAGEARRPLRAGAHRPPFRWRKRERSPRAVSHPVGLRERARAYEALESPAVGMHFAPVLTGKVDHGETGGRQPLI